jgi:hypothetical protein
MRRVRCSCGLLEKYARDPRVPVSYQPDRDTYLLDASPDVSAEVSFCPFCGGYEKVIDREGNVSFFQGGPRCRCRRVKKLAADTDSVISYDKSLNEYEAPGLVLYYCPFCGGRMPESKRGTFFMKPSRKEADDFRSRVKGCNTIEDVIATFGEPDHVTDPIQVDVERHRVYGGPVFKKELKYARRWKTICVTVCLDQDNELHFLWSAKPKRKRRQWLSP